VEVVSVCSDCSDLVLLATLGTKNADSCRSIEPNPAGAGAGAGACFVTGASTCKISLPFAVVGVLQKVNKNSKNHVTEKNKEVLLKNILTFPCKV